MKPIILISSLFVIFLTGFYLFFNWQVIFFGPTETTSTPGITVSEPLDAIQTISNQANAIDIEIIATDLEIPWEIAFLPDGEMLVTERPGRLLKISEDRSKSVIEIPGVSHVGEAGLQGLAIHPNFNRNNWIYLYLTTEVDSGLINRVERFKFQNHELSERKLIIDNIPGARFHDGGRIAFGPDSNLYITTGDAGNPDSAQDSNSLAGKILRLTEEGDIPEDNPFQNPVFSYGHRNPQGITWDAQGQIWSTEHGRSGFASGLDELNLIEIGKNYGWPIIQGDETNPEMESAKIQSGPDETWAPADIVYLSGSLFFTGLRGATLYQAVLDEQANILELKSHFRKEFGRLRALSIGPDGYLYLGTSNRDGRGSVDTADDKIIRINPEIFM